MRTEDDVRSALETLEREAPEVDEVLRRFRSRGAGQNRSRRRTLIAVVAATAAGIVVPVVVVAISGESDERPAEPTGPGWAYAFGLDLPDGWQVSNRSIEQQKQTAAVYGMTGQVCEIVLYRPGAFDTASIPPSRTAVTVNGRPGYVADIESLRRGLPPEAGEVYAPGLVWRYADGSWVSISCSSHAPGAQRQKLLDDEFTVARAVTMEPQALRMPYRIRELPVGWSATSVAVLLGGYMGPVVKPDLTLEIRPAGWSPRSRAPAATPAAAVGPNITVLFTRGITPFPPPNATRTTINGRAAWIWRDRVGQPGSPTRAGIRVVGAGFEIRVETTSWTPGFDQTLRAVASAIEVAPDLGDQSTWFDGTIAIP